MATKFSTNSVCMVVLYYIQWLSLVQVSDGWTFSTSFVPSSGKKGRLSIMSNKHLANPMIMYFDDISRNSIRWNLPGGDQQDAVSRLTKIQNDDMKQQRDDYNFIRSSVDSWARDTKGILYDPSRNGNSASNVLYQNVLGETMICNSNTIFGCIAQFWTDVVQTIIEGNYFQRYPFHRWFMVSDEVTFVQFVAFPNIPILQTSYNDMIRLKSIFEYCIKEHTNFINQEYFSFEIFHPDQPLSRIPESLIKSNSSSYIPPPFPILALQFKPNPKHQKQKKLSTVDTDVIQKSEKQSSNFFSKTDDDDELDDSPIMQSIVNSPIRDFHDKQQRLKRIFNSEAADRFTITQNQEGTTLQLSSEKLNSGHIPNRDKRSVLRKYFKKHHHKDYDGQTYEQQESNENSSPEDIMRTNYFRNADEDTKIVLDSSLSLVRNFELEYRLRVREFTNSEIKAMSMEWVHDQIMTKKNPIFQAIDTTSVSGFFESFNTAKIIPNTPPSVTTPNLWFANLIHRAASTVPSSDVDQSILDSARKIQWFVSNETCGEYVYGALWSAINEVHGNILSKPNFNPKHATSKMHFEDYTAKQTRTPDHNNLKVKQEDASVYTNLYAWMNNIVKPTVVIEGPDKKEFEVEDLDKQKMTSSNLEGESLLIAGNDQDENSWDTRYEADGSIMFVAANLYPYNSEAFKRFAISVHLTLRRSLKIMLPGTASTEARNDQSKKRINYYMEVFHPEYVGSKKGYNHNLRRSPFPMLQIFYQMV